MRMDGVGSQLELVIFHHLATLGRAAEWIGAEREQKLDLLTARLTGATHLTSK